MEQHQETQLTKNNNNRVWTGLFLIAVGILLFADKLNIGLPSWVLSWQMLLIGIGVLKGFQSNFKGGSWLILIAVGGIFLWDDMVTDINLHMYFVPIAVIAVGLIFITRPKHSWKRDDNWRKMRHSWKGYNPTMGTSSSFASTDEGEYIEVNSVFGGANKIIVSKNFKGGEINCFMGGAQVDLSQADIQGTVVLEANQVFGGTKLVVPPHWDVKTEITAVFGGVEDKRPVVATRVDPNKVLILKGNTIFGGLEITSFG